MKRILVFIFCLVIGLTGCIGINWRHVDLNTERNKVNNSFGNDKLDVAVREYLKAQPDFAWQTEDGSTNICVFDKLDNNDLFPHYLWVRCGEFALKDGKVEELSGSSLPARIDYPNELSFFDLSKFSHQIPGDGSLYTPDIRKIFPVELQDLVLEYDATVINEIIMDTAEMAMQKIK